MATKASRIALAGSNISSTGEVDADLIDGIDSLGFLSLDGSGRLGIGTSSPSTRLSFGDYIPSNGQTIHTYQSGNVVSGLGIVAGVHRMFTNDGSTLSYGHVSVSDGSTYTERMRIDSSGSVGIGTTSPDARLHVERGSYGAYNALQLENTNGNNGVLSGVSLAMKVSGGLARIDMYNSSNTDTDSSNIIFKTGDGGAATERMRIDASGNVGIGSSSPDIKLHTQIDTATEWTGTANLSNTTNKPIFALRLHNNDSSITSTEVNMLFSAGASGSGQHSIGVKRTGTNTGDMIFRRRTAGSTSAETMRIDSSGYVHMPQQPVALYYDVTDAANPSDGDKIAFDSKAGFTRGITDSNSKSRFTVPADGIYGVSFTVSGSVTTPVAGDGLRILVKRSGTIWASVNAYSIESGGSETGMEWTFRDMVLMDLDTNMYIELEWQNIGGTTFTSKYGNINIWKVA